MTLPLRLFPFAFLALSACKGEAVDPVLPPPPGLGLLSVSVAPTGVDLAVGASLQMQASSPQVSNGQFTWTVNDTSRASVSSSGLVLGKRIGSIAVIACGASYAGLCGSATITIVAPPAGP